MMSKYIFLLNSLFFKLILIFFLYIKLCIQISCNIFMNNRLSVSQICFSHFKKSEVIDINVI